MIGKIESNWISPSDLASRIDAEYYQQHYVEAQARLKTTYCVPFHTLWKDAYRIYMGIKGYGEVSNSGSFTPYLRPVDIDENGYVNFEQLGWCEASWLKDYGEQGTAKPGDMIVEVKGNTRKVAVLPARVPTNCVVSGSSWRIQISEKADKHFVQAFLLSETGQILKRRQISNSIIPWIDPEAFRKLLIPLPDPKIQTYIGDKVRLAEKCREEAVKLYHEALLTLQRYLQLGNNLENHRERGRFVSADLVDDRLDVNYYAPNALAALETLREGEEKGLFTMQSLEAISTHLMDFQAFSIYNSVEFSEEYKSGWKEFLRVQDSEPLHVKLDKVLWTSLESHQLMPKSVAKPGDLLLSIIGTLGIAAIWPEDSHECNSNQCIVKITVKPEYDPYYLAFVLNMPEMQAIILREATGTVQKGLTLGRTRKFKVPIPDKGIMKAIGQLIRNYSRLLIQSKALVNEAMADVENLVDGKLATQQIMTDNVKPMTWADIYEGLKEK